MLSIGYLTSRHGFIRWALFFSAWMGVNLLILFGPESSNPFWHPKSRGSWRVNRQYQSREWTGETSAHLGVHRLKYRVLEPRSTDLPQPLLLFLHGAGDCGDDNTRQLMGLPTQLIESSWRNRCPGFVIAPQCPSNSDWQRELPALVSLIEAWRNDPRVDRRRIYLTGFSMGGYGTWHLVTAKPGWFAAVAPICGGGDFSSASRLTSVPIWAIHGGDDKVVSPEQSRTMIDAIKSAGGSPKYTELPGVGHESWTETYRDPNGVLNWMYQHINTRCEECE